MKTVIIICFLTLTGLCYGQTYTYSYEGTLTPAQSDELASKCSTLNEVSACKVKQKEDNDRGEIIIELKQREGIEKDHPFSPVDIKALLLNYGLTPMQFTELK